MFFIGLLFLVLLLIPLGVLYGLVARIMLLRRRRAARAERPDSIGGRAGQAAIASTRQQRLDLALSLVLCGIGFFVLGVTVLDGVLDAQGYDFNTTSTFGNLLTALDDVALVSAVVVAGAIPLSAVLVARQVSDRLVLAGEAFALVHRSGRYRRIRFTHLLSSATFTVYSVAGVVFTVVAAFELAHGG